MTDELTLKQKARRLKRRYGGWSAVERRTGVKASTARMFVQEGEDMREQHRQRIERAYRRYDAEHVIGLEAVTQGLQGVLALRQTDLDHQQKQILSRLEDNLKGLENLLLTGDTDELIRHICD